MLINNLDSIFFQAGTGCVSDCKWCLRQFWEKKIFFDELIANIQVVAEKKIFSNNIMIYNIDYFSFSHEEIGKILSFSENFKKISFHTDFRNMNLSTIRPNIRLVYQKNFSLSEILFLLNFINLNIEVEVLFAYWCDNFDYIVKLMKMFKFHNIAIKNFQKNENEVIFNVSDNIHLKFFLIKEERLELKQCYFDNVFDFLDEKVSFRENFYLWYLEIQTSWDIRVHEPPCGFGDLIISNIYRDEKEILNDFKKFSSYIDDINIDKISQIQICSACKNKKFHYAS